MGQGDLLHQIQIVLCSPDSWILDCVVPNSDLRSIVPNPVLQNTYAAEWRTSVNAYVDSTRTTEKYVSRGMTYVIDTHVTEDTYVGRVKRVRQESAYVTDNTYVGMRTRAKCVRHRNM